MADPPEEHPNVTHPGRENVHPLFDPTRFAPDIDYEAFYEPCVLATRLINSPQGLQHDYCFYFGKTVPAATPSGFVYEKGPRQLPYQYACDKSIGELNKADVKDVQKQRLLLAGDITFIIDDNVPPFASCRLVKSSTGKRTSLIRISRSVYNDALAKKQTAEHNARVNLKVACILIHEVAHAANNRLFGPVREDYREDSHVAECGFEAVARIFGYTPVFRPNDSGWSTWQHRTMHGAYDMSKRGRKAWQLPVGAQAWRIEPDFVMKLSDDDFWEADSGEYVQRGALALIPDCIPTLCQPEYKDTHLYKAIPLSIRDLFRTEGPSYAKKRYASYANPERQLRIRPKSDYRFREMQSAGSKAVLGDWASFRFDKSCYFSSSHDR